MTVRVLSASDGYNLGMGRFAVDTGHLESTGTAIERLGGDVEGLAALMTGRTAGVAGACGDRGLAGAGAEYLARAEAELVATAKGSSSRPSCCAADRRSS